MMLAITRSIPWPSVTRPGLVPERVQVRLVEHPPGQVDDRGCDGPDRELLQVAADEADRAHQPEHERDRAEEQRPEPALAKAEHALRQRGGRGRDDDQLE